MSTIYLDLPVDTDEFLDNVCRTDEKDFLLEAFENFDSNNVNAALREYFEDKNERETKNLGCVGYFEEERTLLDLLERFDCNNVNAALREHFGSRAERRASLPDFIDPTKL